MLNEHPARSARSTHLSTQPCPAVGRTRPAASRLRAS